MSAGSSGQVSEELQTLLGSSGHAIMVHLQKRKGVYPFTISATHLHLSFITEVGAGAFPSLITFTLTLTGRCLKVFVASNIVTVFPRQSMEIVVINYSMSSLINCRIVAYFFPWAVLFCVP